MGQFNAMILSAPVLQHDPECEESDQAGNHRKGVIKQIAGLPTSAFCGETADQSGGTVHQTAVDHTGINLFPEPVSNADEPADKNFLIKLVKIILMVEQLIETGQLLLEKVCY